MLLIHLVAVGLLQNSSKIPIEVPVLPQFYRTPTRRPYLVDVTVKTRVEGSPKAKDLLVTLRPPNNYSGQAVIGFKVTSDPPTALKSWKWVAEGDGLNNKIEARLNPHKSGVSVSYVARMLVPGEEVVRTQKRNFDRWLAPTSAVQSNNPEILALSKRLQAQGTSRAEFVEHAVKWVANNKSQQQEGAGRDALFSLHNGGDSYCRSCLCAAILRAGNVAARLVCYAATWAERMDARRWAIEYASDDGDWEFVEPTIGILLPARDTAAYLLMPSEEDEYKVSLEPATSTSVRVLRIFPGPSGPRVMISGYRRSLKLAAAVKDGKDQWFDETVFQDVLAGGPVNLALFLDGRETLPKPPKPSP